MTDMTDTEEFEYRSLQACDLIDLPDAAIRLLLAELDFVYTDTLAHGVWFMQDRALLHKVLRNITLHNGQWFMQKLHVLYFGKNPAHATPAEQQTGEAAVQKIVYTLQRLQDEGSINYITSKAPHD